MGLPANMAKAVYSDPGIEPYRGNPLIEALPPIMTMQQIKQGLSGSIQFDPKDKRRRDLSNMAEGVLDCLVGALVLDDDNYNIVMKSQLAQPIVKRTTDTITFKVKFDF